MMLRRRSKVVLLVGSILLVGYLSLQGSPPNKPKGRGDYTSNGDGNLEKWAMIMKDTNVFKRENKTPPVVLLFHTSPRFPIWGRSLERMGNSSFLHLRSCPHRCYYSLNRSLHEETANLVVVSTFYFRDTLRSLTPNRIKARQDKMGQIWLGVNNEAPLRQWRAGVSLDGVFNWIATYRRDADIYWPYGEFFKHNSSTNSTTAIPWERKKLATWLVSNCETNSMRRVLVRNLQRFIPIDIYGKCQKLKCPPEQDCRAFLGQTYKFYMAFENSLCLDYLTEKVFNAYKNNLVPVIYAWLNDSTLLPPGSYINALDFSTPKHLADYLLHLDTHEDEYLNFFKWQRSYGLKETDGGDMLCEACGKLHQHLDLHEGNVKRHSSMLGWLNSWERKGGSAGLKFKFGPNMLSTGDKVCVDASVNADLLAWLTR